MNDKLSAIFFLSKNGAPVMCKANAAIPEKSINSNFAMNLLFTVPSTIVSLRIERNEDHSVTLYWQEPAAKGGNDLRYCVIVNNDPCTFVNVQNYTIYQEEETKKYTVSVSSIAAYLNMYINFFL